MKLSEEIEKLATECTYPDEQRLQVLIYEVAKLARMVEELQDAAALRNQGEGK